MKKIFIICSIILFLLILYYSAVTHSYPTGFTGVTYKNGGTGCLCHGFDPNTSTNVFFSGPDSVAAGQSANFMIKIVNSSGVTGGFDAASFSGILSLQASDTTLRLDSSRGELTHKFPKQFVNDTVYWSFKYTAPALPQVDTLYAVGNSTNNDGFADSSDQWNFSENFIIKIYIPIGISNNTKTADGFELAQNYPNPFNPETNVEFKVGKREFVSVKVYDINGNETAVLANSVLNPGPYNFKLNASSLSSGVYFCVFKSSSFTSSIKMLLIK